MAALPPRHWTGIACHAGPDRTAPPRAASRRLTPVPSDADPDGTGLGLSALFEREVEQLRQLSRHDGVHTAVLAVDSHHWQVLRLMLWADTSAPDEDATERGCGSSAVTGSIGL
ncbi:DUF4865 family protein [Sphaerisporangium perillae]|uniref:DUF4865 family protein n=1 Tax=Sphaerisporangium perillae TaxID=2935860 RepID=UPI0024359CBB|nr:DUF4865 family protein [Sphaerisporangium perillae]